MNLYNFNINTFLNPPQELLSLTDLEQLCNERLKLYKIMNNAHDLHYKPNSKTWEKYVGTQIIQHNLKTYMILLSEEEYNVGKIKARKNNHISHWLLSLCYCRSGSLRTFFITYEIRWFFMLYKRMKRKDLQAFFLENGFNFNAISHDEKMYLKEKLLACRPLTKTFFEDIGYFKIQFTEVIDLLAARKVFMRKGFAYIPETDIQSCVKVRLWRQFSRQLNWTNIMCTTNIKEERLEEFLKTILIVLPPTTVSNKAFAINLENIDAIANSHFPLCMKTIHSVLRKEHHLKYDCKMQYGIFLKWAGLSYQDAMEFWKTEFTKKMLPDLFERKYSYLFKHQYGQIGSRIDYRLYSCDNILNNTPGPLQHHGCPFKHWDVQKLTGKCREDGFNAQELSELKHLIRGNKFKEACTLYFSIIHKVYTKDVIKSPNMYLKASYDLEDSFAHYMRNIFKDC